MYNIVKVVMVLEHVNLSRYGISCNCIIVYCNNELDSYFHITRNYVTLFNIFLLNANFNKFIIKLDFFSFFSNSTCLQNCKMI